METSTIVSNMGVLDIFFISVFLVGNIVLGFISRRKCWDAKEAVFGKSSKFSNFTLLTSICATLLSATFFMNSIQKINIDGLPFVIDRLIMRTGTLLLTIIFLVPRIVVTKMAFSWYEYIGKIYGEKLRVIFATVNVCLSTAITARLFFVLSIIFSIILGCSAEMAKIFGIFFAIILISYSAFGGLRAVTITDVFQFFVFITVILFLTLFFWIKSPAEVHTNFVNLFNGSNPKMTWAACFGDLEKTMFTLSIWMMTVIPDFPQELYQRCYASKNLKQTKKIIYISFFIFFLFVAVVVFLSLQIMASNSNLKKDEIIPYLVNHFSFPGLKGLFSIAVLSLAISTADSVLNGTAIVLTNDIISPISGCMVTSSLIRKMTFVIGFFAIIISYFATTIFDTFAIVAEFAFPLTCFTFLAIILGVRTHKNVIYISMFTGIAPIIIYHMCGFSNYGFFLGAAGNFFGFLISHLIWKKWFRSEDPNMYYNKKDSFKRLKDFEYDDDLMSYTEYKLKSGEWKEDLEGDFKEKGKEKIKKKK